MDGLPVAVAATPIGTLTTPKVVAGELLLVAVAALRNGGKLLAPTGALDKVQPPLAVRTSDTSEPAGSGSL